MKYKVYYVANARMPTERAHGIQLAKFCESLIESGIDLELVVPKRGGDAPAPIDAFYNLRVPVKTRRLPVIDAFHYGRIGFLAGSASFMVSYLLLFLWKKLRGEKFIVYTIDMDQFSFSLIPLAGIPYFAEIHDAKERGLLFHLLFKHARGIIVINAIIKSALMERFKIPEDKIKVWPNGIDESMCASFAKKNDARKKLGLPVNRKIALYLGKIYPWKGLDTLARASCLLPHVRFYLVGGTADELRSVTHIESDRIFCMGARRYDEIPLWLSAADVCIVLGTSANSYSYSHTSPMKIFEYMMSRRPIVASNTPANREIVTSEDAVFYEHDNEKDLAEKVHHALTKKKEVARKVRQAYQKSFQYTWQKRAEDIIRFMDENLENVNARI